MTWWLQGFDDYVSVAVVTIFDLVRATLEVHRNSPCLSCILSKFHHRNRHIGMPMAHGWQQGLVFGPWFIFIWLPLWGCVSMQLLQELPLKFAWLLQRPPLFSISPQVLLQMSFGAYGCRGCHLEVFFFGPKNWTPKDMVPPCSCW